MQSYRKSIKKTLLKVLGLIPIPNSRYFSKCFPQFYRAQFGIALLVYLLTTPQFFCIKKSKNACNCQYIYTRLTKQTYRSGNNISASKMDSNVTQNSYNGQMDILNIRNDRGSLDHLQHL